MTDLTKLPDPDAEAEVYASLHSYDADERLRYASIGLMVLAVHKRMLWRHRIDPADGFPCRSFARWVRIACPYSYSTVYAALRDVEELQDVPAADLAQIPQSNMRTMKQLSTAVRRDPKVLAAAKGRTESLVAHVKANHPNQHIEGEKFLRVPLNEGQMDDVNKAITKAMERGCASPSEVVWMWGVEELSKEDPTPLADVADGKCGHA